MAGGRNSPVLTIGNAIVSDAGLYACTARNEYGQTRQTMSLSVVPIPKMRREYVVKVGDRLKLPCADEKGGENSARSRTPIGAESGEQLANGPPCSPSLSKQPLQMHLTTFKAVKIRWKKNEQHVTPTATASSPAEILPNGHLLLKSASEADAGVYTCVVSVVPKDKKRARNKKYLQVGWLVVGLANQHDGCNCRMPIHYKRTFLCTDCSQDPEGNHQWRRGWRGRQVCQGGEDSQGAGGGRLETAVRSSAR